MSEGQDVFRFRFVVPLLTIAAMSHLFPGVANAQKPEPLVLVADLEGVPIPATSAADYHCHDFDYPLIHCFPTSQAIDEALARSRASSLVQADGTFTAAAVEYVRFFEYTGIAGSSFRASQNYSNLGTIGWNDRISSYTGLNSETGAFYTDVGYGGTIDYFCCNHSVSLGSTFDNKFSSVART